MSDGRTVRRIPLADAVVRGPAPKKVRPRAFPAHRKATLGVDPSRDAVPVDKAAYADLVRAIRTPGLLAPIVVKVGEPLFTPAPARVLTAERAADPRLASYARETGTGADSGIAMPAHVKNVKT